VNDIEKLNQVIDTLADQSTRVTEFNGILDSVNSSRKQIESIKSALVNLVDEQKLLLSESHKSLEESGKGLNKLDSRLSSLENIQKKMQQDSATLVKLINEASDEQQSSIGLLKKKIQQDSATLAKLINGASDKQQSSIGLLQKILIFGVLLLIGVVYIS